MSFELAPGTLLNNRYQIKKVIAFAEDGGVYLSRDLKVTDRNWIVKEMIPAASLDEETLAERKELYVEAVESIMQFDHPGLSRVLDYFTEAKREYVVMEYVEGVTLQTLCDMSVNPLPEKQILGWSLQICDALTYLHNRPKPFIFHALTPGHIILTSDEKVKLINYGLDRFFTPAAPPKVFTDSPNDTLKEFARFGETMCFLLTKEKPGPFGIPAGANTSPELAKIVNRCLQGESQKTYTSFEDLKKNLEAVLNPPEQPKKAAEAAPKGARSTLPPAWVEQALFVLDKILSQRREFLIAEALLLVGLLFFGWRLLNPTYHFEKPLGVAIGYVACEGNRLMAFRLDTRQIVDRQVLEARIGDIEADNRGPWLFISDTGGNRLIRMNTDNDTLPEKNPFIPVDRAPTRMVIDPRGHNLFVLHETTHNVSRINLQRDPPQMESIMAVGSDPRDLVVSPSGETLFVANHKSDTVSILQPETNKTLATVPVGGGPVALAVKPDGEQLWVACDQRDTIAIIDIARMEVVEVLTEIGGKRPVSIEFSPDGSKAYVVNNRSSNVAVIDTTTRKVAATIAVPATPLRLMKTLDPSKLWLSSGSQEGLSVIDTQTDRVAGVIELRCLPTAETIHR